MILIGSVFFDNSKSTVRSLFVKCFLWLTVDLLSFPLPPTTPIPPLFYRSTPNILLHWKQHTHLCCCLPKYLCWWVIWSTFTYCFLKWGTIVYHSFHSMLNVILSTIFPLYTCIVCFYFMTYQESLLNLLWQQAMDIKISALLNHLLRIFLFPLLGQINFLFLAVHHYIFAR